MFQVIGKKIEYYTTENKDKHKRNTTESIAP
jgi:hypothetical protein